MAKHTELESAGLTLFSKWMNPETQGVMMVVSRLFNPTTWECEEIGVVDVYSEVKMEVRSVDFLRWIEKNQIIKIQKDEKPV